MDIKDKFKALEKDIETLLSFARNDMQNKLLRKEFTDISKADLQALLKNVDVINFEEYKLFFDDKNTKNNSSRERKFLTEMNSRLIAVTELEINLRDIINFHIDVKNKSTVTFINDDIEVKGLSALPDIEESLDIKIHEAEKVVKDITHALRNFIPYPEHIIKSMLEIYTNELFMDIIQDKFINYWKTLSEANKDKDNISRVETKVKKLHKYNQGILLLVYSVKNDLHKQIIEFAESMYKLEQMVDFFVIEKL